MLTVHCDFMNHFVAFFMCFFRLPLNRERDLQQPLGKKLANMVLDTINGHKIIVQKLLKTVLEVLPLQERFTEIN